MSSRVQKLAVAFLASASLAGCGEEERSDCNVKQTAEGAVVTCGENRVLVPAGTPGRDAIADVLRLDDIEPGDVCEGGGVLVEVGPDTDGDGELDDNEVDEARSKAICSGTYEAEWAGDFYVNTLEQLAAAAPLTRITGYLRAGGPAAKVNEIVLPLLEFAGGGVKFESFGLTHFGLPNLRLASSVNITYNPNLPNCEAWDLVKQLGESVGSVFIHDNKDPCEPNPCTTGTCKEDCSAPNDYVCEGG